MQANLIATLKGKIDISDGRYVDTAYHCDRIVTKEDYDNGTTNGIYGFFKTKEDTVDYVFAGKYHEIPYNPLKNCDNLTDEQVKFLDALKEGDVIVFEADILTECHHGLHEIYSYYTKVKNIRKCEDKEAAEKIRRMVDKMP